MTKPVVKAAAAVASAPLKGAADVAKDVGAHSLSSGLVKAADAESSAVVSASQAVGDAATGNAHGAINHATLLLA